MTNNSRTSQLVSIGIALSTAGILFAITSWRSGERPPAYLPPAIRNYPVKIRSYPLVNTKPTHIAIETLAYQSLFPLRETKYAVHEVLHGLRAWGLAHKHDGLLSSEAMLEILTKDEQHRLYYYPKGIGPSLLIPTDHGFTVRVLGGREHIGTASHNDKFLQVMGELSLPSSHIVSVAGDNYALADGLGDSIARFEKGQEPEFTAVAYALYLPPTTSWANRFGEVTSFDDLASILARRRRGACQNIHRLYAISVLLSANEQFPILSASTTDKLENLLECEVKRLSESQRPDGLWDRVQEDDDNLPHDSGNVVLDRIVATGHHLEWMALRPPSRRLPETRLVLAIEGLSTCIAQTSESMLIQHKGPLTHAFRATCMLAGEVPSRTILSQALAHTQESLR